MSKGDTRRQRAVALVQENRLGEARDLLVRLSRNSRRDAELWCMLGAVQGELGAYDEAAECCRKAIALRPDYVEAYNNLAGALELLERYGEAREALEAALKIAPDAPRTIGATARLYEKAGDVDRTYELVRSLVDRGIPDVSAALAFARICRRVDRCGDAIAYAVRVLREPMTSPADQGRLTFSLGTLHEGMGDYDRAFAYFADANRRKAVAFDDQGHKEQIDRVISRYDRDSLKRLPQAGNTSELPVFIVGMPRSGTTLVEQILSNHSRVTGAGELPDIPRAVESLSGGAKTALPSLARISPPTAEDLDPLASDYLKTLRRFSSDALRITDKAMLNFLFLGLIERLFPAARIIHCVRDPIDTCLSCFVTDFHLLHPYKYNLVSLGRFYRQYERLMEHWQRALEIPILDIRYEELVHRPEEVVSNMVRFLGLEWEDQCLRFHESRRIAATASYDQVRQPLYSTSIGRWRNYEKHLGPLIAALDE